VQRQQQADVSPGQVRRNSIDGLEYVWIPPGNFMMGCSPKSDSLCNDDADPPHDVKISKGFWIGKTEVTEAAYGRFPHGRRPEHPGETDLPVVNVKWDDAEAYCGPIYTCRPKRSGSTPRARTPIQRLPILAGLLGIAATAETSSIRFARRRQMRGAFVTCSGTHGNGWPISTTANTTSVACPRIQAVLLKAILQRANFTL